MVAELLNITASILSIVFVLLTHFGKKRPRENEEDEK